MNRKLVILGSTIALGLAVIPFIRTEAASTEPSASTQGPALNDLSSVAPLRSAFNADEGKTRLILLLSPT